MKNLIKALLSLAYPNYCIGCGKIMNISEQFLCMHCRHNLSLTNFENFHQNDFYQQLSPQIPIEEATALFFFQKEGAAQQLIHALKYQGEEQIGAWLGDWLGEKLKKCPNYESISAVIPVPMHPNKEKKRGYNQVCLFAKKIAQHLQADFYPNALCKTHNTSSQTQKDKLLRSESTQQVYALHNSQNLEHQHILLVDDVVTTGATLRACGTALLQIPHTKLSVATMGYATSV